MSRSGGYKCYNIHCNSCIGKTLCGEPEDKALVCDNRIVTHKTNGDRIRSMDDEQLAKLFYGVYKRSCIDFVNQSGIKTEIKFENSEASGAAFLKYLQSPPEEDANGTVDNKRLWKI